MPSQTLKICWVQMTNKFNWRFCSYKTMPISIIVKSIWYIFNYRIRNNDTNGWFRSQELQLKLLKKQLKKMKTTTKLIMQHRSAQITSSSLFGQHLNSMGFCKAETQDKWDLVKFYVVSKRTKVTPVPKALHHMVCFLRCSRSQVWRGRPPFSPPWLASTGLSYRQMLHCMDSSGQQDSFDKECKSLS